MHLFFYLLFQLVECRIRRGKNGPMVVGLGQFLAEASFEQHVLKSAELNVLGNDLADRFGRW